MVHLSESAQFAKKMAASRRYGGRGKQGLQNPQGRAPKVQFGAVRHLKDPFTTKGQEYLGKKENFLLMHHTPLFGPI